jgi:hypothetical protein
MSDALTFDPATHRYQDGSGELAGVTTVIGSVIRKPQLEVWRGNVGNVEADRRRDTAGARGTLVHALAALHVENVPDIPLGDETPDPAQVQAFERWYDQHVASLLACEMVVVNDQYRYAGTLDFLVVMGGDKTPTLVDLKTSASLWPEMRYQTAAYREAAAPHLRALFGSKRCRRGVLHIPEGAEIARFHEHTRHAEDFQGFLSALYLYRDLQRGI